MGKRRDDEGKDKLGEPVTVYTLAVTTLPGQGKKESDDDYSERKNNEMLEQWDVQEEREVEEDDLVVLISGQDWDDVRQAAKEVVECWERGDLAAAVNNLQEAVNKADVFMPGEKKRFEIK